MQPANLETARSSSRSKILWLVLGTCALIALTAVLAVLLVRAGKPAFLAIHADGSGNIDGLTVNDNSLPPEVDAALEMPKVTTELATEQIRELAIQHQLFIRHPANPQLCFIEGDITFWHKQRRPGWEIELEFLARRLLLETADKAQVKIVSQGTLSYYTRRIYATLAARRN